LCEIPSVLLDALRENLQKPTCSSAAERPTKLMTLKANDANFQIGFAVFVPIEAEQRQQLSKHKLLPRRLHQCHQQGWTWSRVGMARPKRRVNALTVAAMAPADTLFASDSPDSTHLLPHVLSF
jgi:hypothetical protein